MSFTRSTTDVHVHRNMPDFPTGEGISATELKTAFDSEAEGLQDDLNRLATELEETTSAASLGAAPIVEGDTSGANVQAKLEKLHEELEGAILGDIPDGSITQAKLNATYEGTLAKKDGTLQTGLSSEKLNGKTEVQLKSAFLSTPNPTVLSFAKFQGSGTSTETKTYSVTGSRYLLLVSDYSNCKIMLLDLKSSNSERVVFAFGFGGVSSAAYNTIKTNSVKLLDTSNYKATLTTAYSNGTLTLNVTKEKTGGDVPAGNITIYELGGIV